MRTAECCELACGVVVLLLVSVSSCASTAEGATIKDISYSTDQTLNLRIVIQSSYSQMTYLLVEVRQPYSPEIIADKTIQVGAGSKIEPVEFLLKPPNHQTWEIKVSLYRSNINGEEVELLQYKIIDINLKRSSFDWNLVVPLLIGILVAGILIHNEIVKRRNRHDWKKRKMKKKHGA